MPKTECFRHFDRRGLNPSAVTLSLYKTVRLYYNRMYGAFANAELFRRVSYGTLVLYNVICELNRSLFDIALHSPCLLTIKTFTVIYMQK